MPSHPRLNKRLMIAAFVLSAIGTVVVLFLLASTGPFEKHGPDAPTVLWSIVLWGMVGIGTWVVLLRLVVLILVPIAALVYRRTDATPAGSAPATESPTPGVGATAEPGSEPPGGPRIEAGP